jgi:hypothetical protein
MMMDVSIGCDITYFELADGSLRAAVLQLFACFGMAEFSDTSYVCVTLEDLRAFV